MRKILILLCAIAVFGLTLATPDAEAQNYNVRRAATVMKVAQYSNNAMVNNLTFMNTAATDADIMDAAAGETLTIKIGYGLLMTNEDSVREKATAKFTLWCDENGDGSGTDDNMFESDCEAANETAGNSENPTATFSNEGGTGVITITKGTADQTFVVAGVRVDASALAVKDTITAAVTSTTDATSVGLGGPSSEGGVSGTVGEVAAGLSVTAEKAASLSCSSTTAPSITVAEGFADAWGPTRLNLDEVGGAADAAGADEETASVKIVLANLPDGAKVEWPATVASEVEIDEEMYTNGMLTMDAAESSSNGKVVVYDYAKTNTYATATEDDAATKDVDETAIPFAAGARSFMVMPTKLTFMGDASVDVSAMLYPDARRGTDGEKLDLESMLSFEHPEQAPEKGNGEGWLVISECVTYLLYPFITCGATPGWSTGISVSNTSADGNVFGAFDESSQQHGSVIMYGFPRERILAPVEEEGDDPMVEPVVSTISDQLMSGGTITFDCGTTTMAGMEGYAIIRAGFQHARGMAFVLGNFADGAGVDVSHGYMAEVITNPADRGESIP